MKILNLITFAGIICAIILMILGIIDFLNGGGVFGLKHSSTFFTVANTAFLVALVARFFPKNSTK